MSAGRSCIRPLLCRRAAGPVPIPRTDRPSVARGHPGAGQAYSAGEGHQGDGPDAEGAVAREAGDCWALVDREPRRVVVEVRPLALDRPMRHVTPGATGCAGRGRAELAPKARHSSRGSLAGRGPAVWGAGARPRSPYGVG